MKKEEVSSCEMHRMEYAKSFPQYQEKFGQVKVENLAGARVEPSVGLEISKRESKCE